jgi:hypothetical protein
VIWRPLDWLGRRLADCLGATVQLRIGIICVLLSLPLIAYGPRSDEPLLIYEMSAVALTLTGAGLVISAQVLLKQERQDERQAEEIAGAVVDRLRAEGVIH